MNKIAVVTGASSGFGLLTTMELAKSGFLVVATMRNTEKSVELMKLAKTHQLENNIFIEQLDVTSSLSIEEFKFVIQKYDRVDILVNNAGYAGGGFIEEIPIDEYRKQFETNVFGLIAVTQLVLPLMRNQREGKIINVSSISGRIGFPGLSPYVASKHAIEGWSECLRLEMKPFGVDVVLIEPGSYKTNIWTTGKQVASRSQLEESPYYKYMKKIEGYINSGEKNFGDPKEVAKKIADIARMKEPSLRVPIGKGTKFAIMMKNTLVWRAWEKIVLKRFI